ncbi:MAG: ATP-binding protein, partial [Oscillospiraceae bacterium]|nr:ATP-binding protein [Oscillospiraceae bacterium]
MARFIGRKEELTALEKAYQKEGFQMAVVYGRRRVGKTTLLREFCKNKRCVYYTAIKSTAARNTELLGQAVLEQLAPNMLGTAFKSLDMIFDY